LPDPGFGIRLRGRALDHHLEVEAERVLHGWQELRISVEPQVGLPFTESGSEHRVTKIACVTAAQLVVRPRAC
jgi:hypothetical protein